ncbi:MAG: hypothetical protein IPF66_09380 [Holophagales bacterium]|nr:hypothetical protein [Holophagales bacterium]
MSAPSTIFLAVLLVGLWATGTAVLLRVGRGDEDEAGLLDGAVALGLPVGLVLFAFPGWLLTTFGRIPFVAILVLGGIVAAAALVFCGRGLGGLRSGRPGSARVPPLSSLSAVLLPVLLLLALFAAYLWLRLGWPDVRGTEKPMDLAVLSSLLVTPRLPLEDPWFAGERFPYYHFGTYVLALPFRLASVPPAYAYNLIVALVAALAGAAAFGVVRFRGGGRVPAVLAALLLAFAGTFDGARQLLAGTPLSGLDLWPSSRRVADTITEWPLFTLWLGDLHPHAVALPLLLAFAATAGRFASGPGLLLDAALLAALFSANPWDLPGALLLLGVGALVTRDLKTALLRSVATLAVSLPFLLPALLSPRPEFQGLRGVTGRTTSPEAFLHLGAMLLVPALAVGIALLRSRDEAEDAFFVANAFPALGLFLAIVTQRPVLGLGGRVRARRPVSAAPPEGRVEGRLSPRGSRSGASPRAGARRRPRSVRRGAPPDEHRFQVLCRRGSPAGPRRGAPPAPGAVLEEGALGRAGRPRRCGRGAPRSPGQPRPPAVEPFAADDRRSRMDDQGSAGGPGGRGVDPPERAP